MKKERKLKVNIENISKKLVFWKHDVTLLSFTHVLRLLSDGEIWDMSQTERFVSSYREDF